MKLGELLIVWFMLACLGFVVGACLWPYTINTWLIYADKPPQFEWWMGGILGVVPVVGQLYVIGAPITFIAMLFIGG